MLLKVVRPSRICVTGNLDFSESYLGASDNGLVSDHNQYHLMPDVKQCGRDAYYFFEESRGQLFLELPSLRKFFWCLRWDRIARRPKR